MGRSGGGEAGAAAPPRRSSAAQALGPGARCRSHVTRAATGVCHRCGDYLCGACGRRVESWLFCEGCAERVAREHGRRAVYALVLGLLGVHGLFFLAPVAAVVGALELGAIREGEAPLGGRGLARAGMLLGVCGVAIVASVVLVLYATARE